MARVLLINDEADLMEMCEVVLESIGHTTKAALEPTRGLDLANEWQPEVVVLDLVMPLMDGEIVFRKLRAGARTSNIPVVVISALADAKDRAMRLGADGFIAKPFDPDALKKAVNHALTNGSATAKSTDGKGRRHQ